ncbi:charged multivesicular body protein 7 [Diabrotica undecimpunctata]|uniref:charged multivesicular body protein 7 n=1 Tax=Diabrotica undecimpunctata TaxID=50387 RepID=UPI003B63ECD1
MFNISEENLPECLQDENRLNVLFAPIRNRSVNPKDWDNKISSWKTIIKAYCDSNDIYTFTLSSLNAVFVRNGRPPSCLSEVLSEMERIGDIQPLEVFLKKNNHSWTGWATDLLVKRPFIWSFNKVKSSMFTQDKSQQSMVILEVIKSKCDQLLKSVPDNFKNKLISLKDILDILNKSPTYIDDVKLILHYMSNNNLVDITHLTSKNENELETTLIKFTDGSKNNSISELDIGIYTLEQNEKVVLKGIEEMEDTIEKCTQEAKMHLAKNHRQMAKSCLRKKHGLEKSLEKKANALHNIQTLLHQIHETHSNAHVWESYKNVLSAFNYTFKETGLSEETIDDTMIKLGEVLDKNEDIQSALSRPTHEFDEAELEEELADLLKEDESEGGPPDGGVNTSDLEDKLANLNISLPEIPDDSPNVSREIDASNLQIQ